MADIESARVATGADIIASHMRRLRNDVLYKHTHEKLAGGDIDHSTIVDGTIAYHTHTNIRKHLMAGGSSFVDDPGGQAGVHGLSFLTSMAGGIGDTAKLAMVAGRYTLNSPKEPSAAYWTIHYGIYQAGLVFTETPMVLAIPLMTTQRAWYTVTAHVISRNKLEFVVWANGRSPYYFDWVAVGPIEES